MRVPLTLSLYIGRCFALSILYALLGLGVLILVIDGIELIRRTSGNEVISSVIVAEMVLLRLPYHLDKLLPFAVLIGGMVALTRLTRTQELVIARAAGVSVWQFLAPALLTALAMGIFFITIFSPISSAMLMRYEHLEGRHFENRASLLSVSSSGLWLRQVEDKNPQVSEHIIYALRISQSDMSFSNVVIFSFDRDKKFAFRLDAAKATLEPGRLYLHDVTRSFPGKPPEKLDSLSLPTELQLSQIQDSFASPETMSFWHLPSFINMLEKAGFSALRHKLYWQGMLAKPVLLCGMILVAALFSLRLPRRGKIGILMVAGVVTGFSFHFFNDLVQALGAAGSLPIGFAAWSPAFLMLGIGTATLLHLEDG